MLMYYGHVRSSRDLEGIIMEVRVEGYRPKGRWITKGIEEIRSWMDKDVNAA